MSGRRSTNIRSAEDHSPEKLLPSSSDPDMPSSKSVYLRAMNFDGHGEELYTLAVNVPEEDEVYEIRTHQRGAIPVLTPIKAANIPQRGGFAAVGKTVYRIGGSPVKQQQSRFGHHRSLASLFSLDDPQGSWKRLAPMRIPRSRPQTVAVDGKIYVIGGAEPGEWGEVFDTQSGKWDSLSPPSQLPDQYGLFAVALPEQKKFVLGSYEDQFLYFYEVEEGRWKLLEHKMDEQINPNIQPVGVGSYLIWLQNEFTLHAYDWIEERSYLGSIRGLDKALPLEHLLETHETPDDPTLIHLSGNLFCLFYEDHLPVGQRISLLHCVTFHISLPPNGKLDGMLEADVKSPQVFVIPSSAGIWGAAVPT